MRDDCRRGSGSSEGPRLEEFCAPGADFEEMRVRVNEHVDIRVVRFTPARDSGMPAVLFVPGWITIMEAWKEVLVEMTKDFPVIYMETREKSSSRIGRNAQISVTGLGEDVVRTAESFGLQDRRFLAFGSSLGATVLLDCCNSFRNRPLGLVLVGPNAAFRVPLVWKAIIFLFYPRSYFLIKPFVKWHLRHFRLNIKVDRGQYEKYCRNLDAADPWKLKKAAMAFWNYQVWDRLPEIDMPVLILKGAKDKLHEPEALVRMESMLKKGGSIDMGTNKRTHTAEIVELLRKFVRETAAGPG